MIVEVNIMDEHLENTPQEPEEEVFTETPNEPRPMWQRWLARIGLVVFLLFLAMYYINMFRGG